MYSTDFEGTYPKKMSLLTPNYLKTIPECPAAGSASYTYQEGLSAIYNEPKFENYYFFQCEGEHHSSVSVPANYPQYDGISGLIER